MHNTNLITPSKSYMNNCNIKQNKVTPQQGIENTVVNDIANEQIKK